LDTDDHRVDAGQGHARHREERRDERAAGKKDGKAPTEISLWSVHDHLRLSDALEWFPVPGRRLKQACGSQINPALRGVMIGACRRGDECRVADPSQRCGDGSADLQSGDPNRA
jgi:hypothetical protein